MTNKLEKLMDEIWAHMVYDMNEFRGHCEICGTKSQLYAHHFITTKDEQPNWRYNIFNGAAICYHCHMNKMHGGAVASVTAMMNCYKAVADQSHGITNYYDWWKLMNKIWPEDDVVSYNDVFDRWRTLIKATDLLQFKVNYLLERVSEYENIFTAAKAEGKSRPHKAHTQNETSSTGHKRNRNRQDNHEPVCGKRAARATRSRRVSKGGNPELDSYGF